MATRFVESVRTPTRTPERSPRRGRVISHAQKQAIIDNLQLEITERARKLRAQYALQAQGLRARLEMRINRIPQSLRKMSMEELVNKSVAQAQQQQAPTGRALSVANPNKINGEKKAPSAKIAVMSSVPSPVKSKKRTSAEMSASEDKENVQTDLNMPKKRAKTALGSTSTSTSASTGTRPTRTTSRKVPPSQVLSPKSNNSRTLPRSPLKPSAEPASFPSPVKNEVIRIPAQSAAYSRPQPPSRTNSRQANTNAASLMPPPPVPSTSKQGTTTRGKRAAATTTTARSTRAVAPMSPKTRTVSNSSDASNSSSGTAIVKRGAAKSAAPTTAVPAKKGIVGRVAAGLGSVKGKKEPATKTTKAVREISTTTTTTGRVLRKRG